MASSIVHADGSTGVINDYVIDRNGQLIIISLDGPDGYAVAYSTQNDIFQFLKGEGASPIVYAVKSGTKYMQIADYAVSYSTSPSAEDAMLATNPIPEEEVNTYFIFEGFDDQGDPILTPIFDRIRAVVDELQNIYQYLDEAEKPFIRDARTALADLAATPEDLKWDDILLNLSTTEVETLFTAAEKVAKVELIAFAEGLGNIYYSEDAAELEATLRGFKDTYQESFQILFGTEISIVDLYDFLVEVKNTVPSIIATNAAYINALAFGSDQNMLDTMPQVLKEAAEAAILEERFTAFRGKLDVLGWSADLLISERVRLAGYVDADRKAELALAKATVRSESKLIEQPDGPVYVALGETIYLNVSEITDYLLEIMGRQATGLVDWVVIVGGVELVVRIDEYSHKIEHAIADIEEVIIDGVSTIRITPKAAGQLEIVVVRGIGGGSVGTDWILRLILIVT
jgi:hypothetical protein